MCGEVFVVYGWDYVVGVSEVGLMCQLAMLRQARVPKCGEQHVVGGAGRLRLFVVR